MKGSPLQFDFEGKGVLDLELLVKNKSFFTLPENSSHLLKKDCFLSDGSFGEPTSVLDSTNSGGPTFSSTPSSSHGGGGGVGVVSGKNHPSPIFSSNAKHVASPGQDHSVFRWIMGDTGLTAPEFEFCGGFGVSDQGDQLGLNFPNVRSSGEKTDLPSNSMYAFPFDSHSVGQRPPAFNLINQHQHQPQSQPTHNPSFFLPFQQDEADFEPPQAKRPNLGGSNNETPEDKWSFPELRKVEILPSVVGRHQFPFKNKDPNPKTGRDIDRHQQQQVAIIDQLYNVAELVQTGNLVLVQEILARLNHFLSPTGNPFNRAAFYCKEALQLLLQTNHYNNSNNLSLSCGSPSSPFDLVFKIAAYKSFSEISPSVEFASFTCNQALLEAVEGFIAIHIVDFDIGLGGQWAPLMQELALRGPCPPSLKITAIVASHSAFDQLGLCLVQENLVQFATELNLEFQFEVMGIESLNSSLNSGAFRASRNGVVAVNLPASCISDYDLPPPLFLRLVKQMSPRIVVSVDVGCQRTDLPFADHIIHALHSCTSLLESLDAVNANTDAVQRIERFLVQPGIEKIVARRFRGPGKSQHWRNLFLSAGFSPVSFSSFAESQAECVVKRMPVRGFQVEKRQSSLVLSWQRKELVSASVWRC